MSTRKRRDPRSLEPEAPEMYAAPKRRRKTVRPPDDEPNVGRIIENGLAMLIPFIIERIVVNATARHEPMPPPAAASDDANRAYGIGLKDATERLMSFVPVPVPGCPCTACKSLELYADKFGRARVQ